MTYACEYTHDMRPNRSDHARAVGDRIEALPDAERLAILHWLAGYNPNAVALALEHVEAMR
jgi:DNA-binding transcriptional ArsR family regulator